MANTGGERTPEIGPGMRVLKIAVIAMGVLIIGGTTALVVLIAHRLSAPGPVASRSPTPAAAPALSSSDLGEPSGSRIVAISRVANGLALAITGGGEPDRLLVIDPSSGRVLLRIRLAR